MLNVPGKSQAETHGGHPELQPYLDVQTARAQVILQNAQAAARKGQVVFLKNCLSQKLFSSSHTEDKSGVSKMSKVKSIN